MRHLFVPACLCLLILPGAIDSQPGFVAGQFLRHYRDR